MNNEQNNNPTNNDYFNNGQNNNPTNNYYMKKKKKNKGISLLPILIAIIGIFVFTNNPIYSVLFFFIGIFFDKGPKGKRIGLYLNIILLILNICILIIAISILKNAHFTF